METLKAYREHDGYLTVITGTGNVTFPGLIEALEEYPEAFIDVVEPTTLHAHDDMTYRLHYISQDVDADTWSVYVEEYNDQTDAEPIDGSQRYVSTHPDEEAADKESRRLQYGSLHAHVETSKADCDGRYNHDYVSRPDAGQDEYEFKEAIMGLDVSPLARQATLTVDDGGYRWTENTEEGFVDVVVKWCRDKCPDERVYRDHTAEAAGY